MRTLSTVLALAALLVLSPPARSEPPAPGAPPAPPVRVTLAEALRHALANAREIRVADLDAGIARLGPVRARAGYLPRVDAGADLSMLSEPPGAIINGREVQTADRNVLAVRLTAEQTLYDFGRTSARVGQADARYEAARQFRSIARERQAMEVVSAFLSARRAEGLLAVTVDALRSAEDHRRVAGELYRQGAVARNDVLAADVAVANAASAKVEAENRVELARSLLALRMGLPGDASAVPAGGDLPAPFVSMPQLADSVRTASRSRAEVQARELLRQESVEASRAADAELAPSFFGRGGYQYDDNGFNPNRSQLSLLVGARFNLFNGNADDAARRQAFRNVERQGAELALLKDMIALEVKAAHLSLEEAERRREAAGKAVAAATENLRIQDDRYREGIAISTEQIEAQGLLTRARTDLENASHDEIEARYRLLRARGELMDFLEPLLAR